MDARRELLRRILAATGADGRLSEAQREEILGHLEDSVDDKVRSGTAEMEAAAQAFEEIGDLRRIAGEFPAASPALATATGPAGMWMTYGGVLQGYGMFLLFCAFQVWMMPKFMEVFQQVGLQLPAVTTFFRDLSTTMNQLLPLTALVVLALGVALVALARRRYTRIVAFLLGLGSTALIVAAIVGVALPLVAIGSSIGAGH